MATARAPRRRGNGAAPFVVTSAMRVGMSVAWILGALVVPLAAGLLVAWPFWVRRVQDDVGSIAGAGIIMAFVVLFIGREYAEIERITKWCIAAEVGCRFRPEPFVRYAIHAGIGMLQVFVVFSTGLSVDERQRRRDHA